MGAFVYVMYVISSASESSEHCALSSMKCQASKVPGIHNLCLVTMLILTAYPPKTSHCECPEYMFDAYLEKAV